LVEVAADGFAPRGSYFDGTTALTRGAGSGGRERKIFAHGAASGRLSLRRRGIAAVVRSDDNGRSTSGITPSAPTMRLLASRNGADGFSA
jgi:hypothetical protein